MRKSVLRISLFLIILVLLLGYWNSVFKIKDVDGIYHLKKFYDQEENTVDVLILGSSHAFEDFNTGTLWDEYGMSSYVLAGSEQPMWNSYYYLKEGLKTQSPKLIVLEGWCTRHPTEYMRDSVIIKNNFGFHWSKNKIESIEVSAPETRWKEFFLEYGQYHTRYNDIQREDFLEDKGDPFYYSWKGFCCNMATKPHKASDVTGITHCANLAAKTEKYYRMILELAKENGIPIAVVISPYSGITKEDQQIFNSAGEIAAEYDVPFINCNLLYQEIGIDFMTDAADLAHLNYRGSQKFSSFIGKYLTELFEIPDHRGEEEYSSWQNDSDFIRQMVLDRELFENTSAESIVQMIKNPNYWVFVSVDGNVHTSSDEKIKSFMHEMGITDEEANRVWYIINGLPVWDTSMDNGELYISTKPHDFRLKRAYNEKDDIYKNEITIDHVSYKRVNNGVNIVVYDTLTEKIVDCIGLDADEGYAAVKKNRPDLE